MPDRAPAVRGVEAQDVVPRPDASITHVSESREVERKAPLLAWQRDILVSLVTGEATGPVSAADLQSLADLGLVATEPVEGHDDASMSRATAKGREALQRGWYA